MSDIEIIARVLGLSEELAGEVLMLTYWVEHELQVRRHGYPKDNVLPAPLAHRLNDPAYLTALLRAARDDEEAVHPAIAEALSAALR